jgi:molybdenum cofactor cytidylyltransferase
MRIGAVILAAGKASRFGAPKQLLEIDGETLIDRACRTALKAECHPVLRVLGAHADQIMERPCPEGVETFVHNEWETGMGGSLATGVSRLLESCPDMDALFVLLADQPMTTVALLTEMKNRLQNASVVLCGYSETKGPPALFHRRHFGELQALQGDRGAKAVAAHHDFATVTFTDGAWDIDSPDKWEGFLATGPV